MVLDPYFYLLPHKSSHLNLMRHYLSEAQSPTLTTTTTNRQEITRSVAKMLSSVDWTCDGFNKSLRQTKSSDEFSGHYVLCHLSLSLTNQYVSIWIVYVAWSPPIIYFLLRFVVIMESKEGIQPNFLLYADIISTASIPLNRSNYAQWLSCWGLFTQLKEV